MFVPGVQKDGMTALLLASRDGETETLKVLLECGAAKDQCEVGRFVVIAGSRLISSCTEVHVYCLP